MICPSRIILPTAFCRTSFISLKKTRKAGLIWLAHHCGFAGLLALSSRTSAISRGAVLFEWFHSCRIPMLTIWRSWSTVPTLVVLNWNPVISQPCLKAFKTWTSSFLKALKMFGQIETDTAPIFSLAPPAISKYQKMTCITFISEILGYLITLLFLSLIPFTPSLVSPEHFIPSLGKYTWSSRVSFLLSEM